MRNLTKMQNIRLALIAENAKQLENTRNNIIEKINSNNYDWYVLQYLTSLRINQLKKGEISNDKAISIAIKKAEKNASKEIDKELLKIDMVESTDDLKIDDRIIISVDWKKSQIWGMCPKSELLDNKNIFYGSRITGCGYDKESTSIADVLNQYKPILKRLYQLKNNNIDLKNAEIFGYGSGYGIKPYFEGGVGTSCFYRIFEKIGMKLQLISSSKTYDVYEITVIK